MNPNRSMVIRFSSKGGAEIRPSFDAKNGGPLNFRGPFVCRMNWVALLHCAARPACRAHHRAGMLAETAACRESPADTPRRARTFTWLSAPALAHLADGAGLAGPTRASSRSRHG